MNIFFLDEDPKRAAQMCCDQHRKMILESAQLLSTAHHIGGSSFASQLYKKTHYNHPSAVWVRESKENYLWVYEHMLQLDIEMRRRVRNQTPHLSVQKLGELLKKPPECQPSIGLTIPKIAAKRTYQLLIPRNFRDVILAYRYYYVVAKNFSTYTRAYPPSWLVSGRAHLGSLPFYPECKANQEVEQKLAFTPYPLPKQLPLMKGLKLQSFITTNDLVLSIAP